MQYSSDLDKTYWIEEGNQHFTGHRYKEALAAYERAIQLDPGDASAQYHKGEALRRLRRKKDALAAYERATELDPSYAAAYFEKGRLLRFMRWNRKALVALEQALRLDPDNVITLYHTGIVLNVLKRYPEALATFDRIIALDPHRMGERATVDKVKIMGKLQGTEAMLAAFDVEIERASDPSFFLMQKAEALQEVASALQAEQKYEGALAIYDQLLQQYPVDVHTVAKNKAPFERDPRDSIFAAKGKLLLSLRCYEEAMEAFEGFILCGCCFDCVWDAVHEWVLSTPELPPEAWAAYDRLIERSENPIGIYCMLGERLDHHSRHEEARVIHERVIAICDQMLQVRSTGYVYYIKARSLQALGHVTEAQAAFQKEHELREAGQYL